LTDSIFEDVIKRLMFRSEFMFEDV